jgi:hypothetical protein
LTFFSVLVGFPIALFSSIDVLDPSSPLYANDEGLYLARGVSGDIVIDLRYGLFSLLVKSYFLVTQNFFVVVLIHKTIMLATFMCFKPHILRRKGWKCFIFIYCAFLFPNIFFLRDSLIFLFVLFAALSDSSDRSIRSSLPLIPLLITRPQGLFLFLRPWISVVLTVAFIFFMRDKYSAHQIRDNGMLIIINDGFWQDIFTYALITLFNINPLPTFIFYINNNDYLKATLLIFSSISLFAVFAQMSLALFYKNLNNAYFPRIWASIFLLLILYGSIGESIDKRIFLALLSPFLIFIEPVFMRRKYILSIFAFWSALIGIKFLVYP